MVMFITLYWQKDTTLVTVGDALASFLDRPDDMTKSRCLMAQKAVNQGPLCWQRKMLGGAPNTRPLPVTHHAYTRRRWFTAATKRRWIITMGLCMVAVIAGAVLLSMGTNTVSSYLSNGETAFSLGFGAVDSRALINASLPQGGTGGLMVAVLIANLPQAIISFLYLTYNGLLTCMLLSQEYSKYAITERKKPLRVTTPHGQQRSSYYLQLPFTYSLPLIIASGMLHWLVSQSTFLARVDVYDDDVGGQTLKGSTSQIGYSCLPILLTLLLGIAMLAIAVGLGFRKFASYMPVAGSCSVALAAACHRPKQDVDAAYLPVHWGEVVAGGSEDVGHCSFTSEEVKTLSPGRMYAGGVAQDTSRSTASDSIEVHAENSRLRKRNAHLDFDKQM